MSIKKLMTQDHKDCDSLFASAENAVAKNDWEEATQAFHAFIDAMDRHLGIEENELFPAFEAATGVVTGPTEMMRIEHKQMRALFDEMHTAIDAHQGDDYLGTSETVLILMQQHNMKEEQILYNMMDQHINRDVNQWHQKFQDWGG